MNVKKSNSANIQISAERKEFLHKKKIRKYKIFFTQIALLFGFILIWEILANTEIINPFITSSPSRILKTITDYTSNNLFYHTYVTVYETLIGFILGTFIGTIIAALLWWSKFASDVFEPFLIVLHSLPKVALRANYNSLGWCRNFFNNCNGSCNIINCNNFRNVKWLQQYGQKLH